MHIHLATLFALAASGAAPDAAAEQHVAANSAPTPTPVPSSTTETSEPPPDRWITRWPPERNTGELGVFGGVLFPHPRLELFDPDPTAPDQGFVPLRRVAPHVGARMGFYPARVLGVEAEGTVTPTATVTDRPALGWAVRGHVILQLPRASIVPFALAGASGFGISSQDDAVGDDVDLAFHYGVGLKMMFTRHVGLRVDLRDNLTARRGVGLGVVHSPEATMGLMITLGRSRAQATIPDTDGDGILDPDDSCVETPGVPEYRGCPIPDTDGDGILDPDDRCVDVPGVVEYEGCPVPDTDGDGVLDPDDACVDVPGSPRYEGCPIPDTDGDGILDPDDSCVEQPETHNRFQDTDGCPDEVPAEVEIFTGVIEGIFFDFNEATIRPRSRTKLDAAVAVLRSYPSVRLEIAGHTDNKGNDQYNLQLSQDRADAVKAYFTAQGIDGERLRTRGAGEAEPIRPNRSRAGRAANRRIEFHLIER